MACLGPATAPGLPVQDPPRFFQHEREAASAGFHRPARCRSPWLQRWSGRHDWRLDPSTALKECHQSDAFGWNERLVVNRCSECGFHQATLDAGFTQFAQSTLHHLAAIFTRAVHVSCHFGQGAPFVGAVEAKPQGHDSAFFGREVGFAEQRPH